MSGRTVRRFVDGLLRGQRTERARPDELEAEEMKTAIELRAARTGSDSPREEFVTDLHRRLAEQMGEAPQAEARSTWGPSGTRRQVVIGTGLAAASAATGIVVGRNLLGAEPNGSTAGHAANPGCARTQRGYVACGRGQCRPAQGRSARVRPRLGQRVRPPRRRATGGGLGHLHPSGLQALAGRAGKPAALPVPLDVVLAGG